MNPPTSMASRAELQGETLPWQRPVSPVPSLLYNRIIADNIDFLDDSLSEILAGYEADEYHLVKDFGRFGKVVAKHPIVPVFASIGREGQIQELAIDQKELAISKYRTELTVMRKQPVLASENSPQMRAPYEVIDFGEFYQTAGSVVVRNVMNSVLRYNGPRQQRHETQIC